MRIQHLPWVKNKKDFVKVLSAQGKPKTGHYTLEAQPWVVWIVKNNVIVGKTHI